jgi:hypothetical protein
VLLGLASAVTFGSKSRRTRNHGLLSHLRLCSLSVASYDSAGLRWKYCNPPPRQSRNRLKALYPCILGKDRTENAPLFLSCRMSGSHRKRSLVSLLSCVYLYQFLRRCGRVLCHGNMFTDTYLVVSSGQTIPAFSARPYTSTPPPAPHTHTHTHTDTECFSIAYPAGFSTASQMQENSKIVRFKDEECAHTDLRSEQANVRALLLPLLLLLLLLMMMRTCHMHVLCNYRIKFHC